MTLVPRPIPDISMLYTESAFSECNLEKLRIGPGDETSEMTKYIRKIVPFFVFSLQYVFTGDSTIHTHLNT